MKADIFSTHQLPQAQQLDAWRALFDGVFDVAVDRDEQDGFIAESRYWSLGAFGLGRVFAPTLRSSRSKSLLRRNPVDHWVLTVGRTRTGGLSGAGRMLDIPGRTPFLVSLGRELVSDRTTDERLHLYLPRDGFADLAPILDARLGEGLDNPLANLLGDFIMLLEHSLPELSRDEMAGLTPVVRAMVLAGVAPTLEHRQAAGAPIDLSRVKKVRRIIAQNLEHPELGPTMLCREAGLSRTGLYRLFEGEGGINHLIQRERIRKAHEQLSDPTNTRAISAIGASLCFPDPSSFSRAFKSAIGMSPSDVRAAAVEAIRVLPVLTQIKAETRNLRDCLRDFG